MDRKNAKPWEVFTAQKVDKIVKESRYSACLDCDHFIQITKQCKLCGCFMPAKTGIEHAFCPIGKW